MQHRLAAETEQLAYDVTGADAGCFYLFEIISGFCRVLQVEQGEFGIPDNDSENIVKVVGNAASQVADWFHFLSLAKLLFEKGAFFLFAFQRNDLGNKAAENFKWPDQFIVWSLTRLRVIYRDNADEITFLIIHPDKKIVFRMPSRLFLCSLT